MNSFTSVSSFKQPETEYLSFLLQHAFDNHYAVAVWRLPNDSVKHLIISKQNRLVSRDTVIEDLPTGFIFAPFDRDKDSLFLIADLAFSFENKMLKTAQDPLETFSTTWLQQAIEKAPQTNVRPKPYFVPTASSNRDRSDYIKLVNNSIEQIEKGNFEKVVPSRTKVIDVPIELDVIAVFESLCEAYPNALVSFVSSPEAGTWLGATPEVLVTVEDKSIFRTVALAGTKPYQEGTNLKSVAWTQKEIEEQALVERYIISCFKKIRLREYEEHGPKTVVAGNLMHLKSDFTVDMKETNFPQLGSVMLQLLHPTSAVCGMPLDTSLEFLKTNEGYDREFYSGFLGPVNFNKNINIFVNLRCLKLMETKAILYAGAGVTIDSTAEEEWKETEMKLNTLLKIIQYLI